MSYSRWGTSHWYTYWCTSPNENRHEQLFDICTVRMFTYKQLIDDIDKCLKTVKEETGVKQKKIDELRIYMLEFISDVKKDKSLIVSPSDRYKEGEISLDEAFIEEV